MDADDCARIIEGVAAVLDLLAAEGDAVDDPAPIYELLAEPSVSAASVSARFPSLSGQCSGRCVAT